MTVSRPPIPITKAVDAFWVHLKERSYRRLAIKHIRTPLNKYGSYARKTKIRYFSQRSVSDFLGIARPRYSSTPGSRMRKDTEHAMRIFKEFTVTGSFQYRKRKDRTTFLPPFMEQALLEVRHQAETQMGWRIRHIDGQGFWMCRFMEHIAASRLADWNELSPAVVSGWLVGMNHLSRSSRCAAFTAVRFLLKTLFRIGKLTQPLHDFVWAPRRGDDRRLSHIWDDGEIDGLFAAIDSTHPEGKRDRAIILLALRLALRCSDIVNLTLADIHWRKAEISLVQHKTGSRLTLPLPDDLADALVDYLRHARPVTRLREVFLRFPAPQAPMTPVALSGVLRKYRSKAGRPETPGCGMHSLRHTLATRLRDNSVRTEEISALLGQRRLDTTRLYLRTSVSVLQQAGLDPDAEVAHG